MFKNKTTEPSGKKKDVQVRECNMIPMSISPLYDIGKEINLEIKVSESKGYILKDIENFSCLYFMFSLEIILKIVILIWAVYGYKGEA